jgi:guanylate cyclase
MNGSLIALASKAVNLGQRPQDSPEDSLRKTLLITGSYAVIAATTSYGLVYLLLGEPLASIAPLFFTSITLVNLAYTRRTGRYEIFRFSNMLLGLFLPSLLTVLLGGFVGSSATILWALITPMGALLLYDTRQAGRWWYAYIVTLIVVGLLDPLVRRPNNLSPGTITVFFISNLLFVSLIVILFLKYFIEQREEAYRRLGVEEQKAQDLLLNILPREIAAILKNEKRTIADQFEGASILFADLVGFTPLSAELAPVEMVNLLNEIFSEFDALVEKYDLEKIRTIGDNYMVAAGVPRPRSDHAQALAQLALDMRAYLDSRPATNGKRIEFRIGINSGPVIGGVIGRRKFVYDLWGDAVNIASRMESQGLPGRIQITDATYALIKDEFECEERGSVPVKGRGDLQTWFLVRELSAQGTN